MPENESTGGSGPYLTAALLCERVIEDREGVLTAVRIVDRVIQTATGTGTPDTMPPAPVNLTLLIALKSGEARGRHDLQIQIENPSGLRTPLAQAFSILLEGGDRGANLIVNLNFTALQEGLYWFDVYLDGVRITRVPLRLVYQRQETGSPQSAPPPSS